MVESNNNDTMKVLEGSFILFLGIIVFICEKDKIMQSTWLMAFTFIGSTIGVLLSFKFLLMLIARK